MAQAKKSDIILVANKCESNASESGILEAFNLGLGEPVVISAEHGLGMANLYAALRLQEQKLVEKDKIVPSHAEIQHDMGKVSVDLDNFPVEKDSEFCVWHCWPAKRGQVNTYQCPAWSK